MAHAHILCALHFADFALCFAIDRYRTLFAAVGRLPNAVASALVACACYAIAQALLIALLSSPLLQSMAATHELIYDIEIHFENSGGVQHEKEGQS